MGKKRVLIMTASLGYGHKSAANAISTAMAKNHPEVDHCI